jgi:ABC-2 type transport system ATP-binding protein
MIESQGLTRHFGEVTAVQSATFVVADGTILALLGPNGAGKTTTVRMLAGLIAPSEGTATVAGFDVIREPADVRARVGLVTDAPGLHEQMTLPAYLDFFGAIYGMPADVRTRRISELLEFLDLADHRGERMVGFSKGMKQKAALARALLHDPAVLFLDEPTAGLDPLAARAVRELIVNLKHARRSIILCTHDLDEAERLADQVAILRAGVIVALDSPTALRAHATAGALVRIELAEPLPTASTLLAGIEGLASAPAEAGDAADALVIQYHTPNPRRVNPVVLARLVGAGAQIVSVASQTRSLEDVYADALSAPAAELVGK